LAVICAFYWALRRKTRNVWPTGHCEIVNGKGDWMFYGHASATGADLDMWWLLDLRAFRFGLAGANDWEGKDGSTLGWVALLRWAFWRIVRGNGIPISIFLFFFAQETADEIIVISKDGTFPKPQRTPHPCKSARFVVDV
jgi:hypothetical protein